MTDGNEFAYLQARTTIRVEALKYVDGLFSDRNGAVSSSGWKLLLNREFEDRISSSDISSFVDDVHSLCRGSDESFKGFDKARVCAMLMTGFRCTVDECGIGFILKSKTVMERESKPQKGKKSFFLFRFMSWSWGIFKRIYNGFLDTIKIG